MGTSGSGIRIVRTAVFTALCVTLSAGAHVLLTGRPLPLLAVTAVTATVAAVAFLLAGRERGFGQIAALLLPLQLAADTVFTTGQSICYGSAPPPAPLRLAGLELLCAGGDFGTPLARLVSDADPAANPAAPWLLLAIQLAVGLTAAGWLRGGEAAMAKLLRCAASIGFRPLRLALTALPLPAAAAPDATGHVPQPPRPVVIPLLSHSVRRRGPPDRFRRAA